MMKVALSRLAGLFATPLAPADYLALVRPLALAGRARVEAVHAEAPDVRTLVLRPHRGWGPHRAGQHVRVGVVVDGRVATRTFSVASAEGGRTLAITVKAQGRVSRALVDAVEVGTILALGPPEGDFTLPAGRPLFLTAGSGITPVMSMLRTLAARGPLPDIAHVHHARGPAIFGQELRALAAAHPAYRLMLVDTAVDPRRLTMARLAALVPDHAAREAYACGPSRLFADLDLPLRREYFGAVLAPPVEGAPGPGGFTPTPGIVKFGKTAVASDGSAPLLHVAEAAGLAPKHGCRMGICHTCDATLTAGCVRDLRTNTRITEPGARVQICVCAASGDVELTLEGDLP